MRVVFIYYTPHILHRAWAESVTKEMHPFVTKKIFNHEVIKDGGKHRFTHFLRKTPIILQLLSVFGSLRIPKADVYLVEGMACVSATVVRKKKDSKIILINDDPFFYELEKMKGLKKKIFLKYLGFVDGIISASNLMKKKAEKYADVPNKVNYAFGQVGKFSKVRADIKSNDVCFVGPLSEQKRTDLLVEVFLELREKLKNKLCLIGWINDNLPLLEGFLEDKDITVTGFTNEPEKYLEKCGVYINPAEMEAFGANIIEAMCAGIPPLVTASCGASEVVSKVSKELIIEPDVDDIVGKVEWLQSDMGRKRRLSDVCKKEGAKYNRANSVAGFRKVFFELLEEIKGDVE